MSFLLPGINEVAGWPEQRIKNMYMILDEATKIKHLGEVTNYKPIDNDSPDLRHARAVPRHNIDMADVRANAGQTPEWRDAAVNTQTPIKDKLHVSESGATSSHIPLRYDLIPRALYDCAARRYTKGADIHGERGYQRGLNDQAFILNRINHIQEHWDMLLHPNKKDEDGPDGHLGAILWGIGFLCEVMEHDVGRDILWQIIENGRVRV